MQNTPCHFCADNDWTVERTEDFQIIADNHPVAKGHTLIVPKKHLACVGAFPTRLLQAMRWQILRCCGILQAEYDQEVLIMEHGVAGQTIPHAHIHLVPTPVQPCDFKQDNEHLAPIGGIDELRDIFNWEGRYLFVGKGKKLRILHTDQAQKAILRHRLAQAVNEPERGDWREMRRNDALMEIVEQEVADHMNVWKKHAGKYA